MLSFVPLAKRAAPWWFVPRVGSGGLVFFGLAAVKLPDLFGGTTRHEMEAPKQLPLVGKPPVAEPLGCRGLSFSLALQGKGAGLGQPLPQVYVRWSQGSEAAVPMR